MFTCGIWNPRAQVTIRIDLKTAQRLRRMVKQGKYKSLNSLIDSILFEVALDDDLEQPSSQFDKLKNPPTTLHP